MVENLSFFRTYEVGELITKRGFMPRIGTKVFAAFLDMLWTSMALAQPSTTPPTGPAPSGLYEAYSPVLKRPAGALGPTPPTILPRWLEVRTTGSVSVVTLQPEKRVTWRLVYGPHGLREKIAEVDGELWTRSVFTYDAGGRLQRKEVTGPGVVNGPWISTYRTDARGRVIERSGRIVLRHSWGSRNLPPRSLPEKRLVTWGATVLMKQFVDSEEVRRDRFDRSGRLLRTDLMTPGRSKGTQSLVYHRDKAGRLLSIKRVRNGRGRPALFARRDKTVGRNDLEPFYHSLVERHEALLLLGSPVTRSDSGRGAARRVSHNYSDDCWLNAISSLEFDATGLLVSTYQSCVCGFCVDADLPVEATRIEGVDLHWTEGPWIRLDGFVDVTAEHEVMTPAGPRRADSLSPGDEVLPPEGGHRVLRSVRPLPVGRERLGRNVRTADGTFGAGGILFVSEPPCSR